MDRGRLRVVMPMLTLVPGAMGGSETYARALVSGLAARASIELTVLLPIAAAGSFPEANEIIVDGVQGTGSARDRAKALAMANFLSAELRAVMRAADVVHYPFTVPVPRARGPWIQTLLDVQHLDMPSLFSPFERAYRHVAYDMPARRADRVLTISDFCRERIVTRLNVPTERINVVPLGVDTARFTPSTRPRESFVFYPATAWPHKNHFRLIEAMRIVRRERPQLRLVLTGGRRDRLGTLPEWVEHRGYVGADELHHLYNSASCLAFPSLYEGFGLPPIEAMASGLPVAAARSGSLPEVCGDAAVLFDPYLEEDVAGAVEAVLEDSTQLVARGLAKARTYNWERCVDAHIAAYYEVAALT